MRNILSFLIFFLPISIVRAQTNAAVDTVLARAERYVRHVNPLTDVKKFMDEFNEKNRWPDIDYNGRKTAGWELAEHLQRVRSMAVSWTDPHSPMYKNAKLKTTIDSALTLWFRNRYQNSNWWHNMIGIPRVMQDIIVVLRRHFTADQFKQAMEILGQHEVIGTGANLVWTADLGLHYGALSRDIEMIKKCSDLISNEISTTKAQGIQPDYSYHQHGARLQTYHYGGAFLRENVKLAWELRDTPWSFPQEKVDILVNFVLHGWQWMARGIHTVPGTIDRSVSREDALQNADLRNMIPFLTQLRPGKSDAFEALSARQDGSIPQLTGFKHYPYSDFTAYHHQDFSFFLKTVSLRTRFSENINHENLKGYLLNTGDTYYVRDGMEYFNLMPVWNWEYLPGITHRSGAKPKQQAFTGGVSDGKSGLTAMHCLEEKDRQSLTVKKIWANHGNAVVCLMADLHEQTDSLYTVFDQCRWRADVTVNSPGNALNEGVHELKNVAWIYHAGFAYMPLSPANIELHLTTATGTWSSINRSGSDRLIREKVFMPVLRHKNNDSAIGYVVASYGSAEEALKSSRTPAWEVIQNNAQCQSVRFRDGTFMAAFHEAASVKLTSKRYVSVDRPCLLLLSKNRIFASDPTRAGGIVKIRVGDKSFELYLPPDGSSATVSLQG